ncbi:MAG: peptide deformylase [Candidatus Paceibacterota bacterium]
MSQILQKGNPLLEQKTREIETGEYSSDHLKDLVKRMSKALKEEEDGFAIAAPQIGESVRVFLVSGELVRQLKRSDEPQPDKVYVNPYIIKRSKETELMEEGCLSVRWWYGYVERYRKVKIKAFTEDGKPFQEGASGVMSQVFQHEIDHLDGILFTEKAKKLRESRPS